MGEHRCADFGAGLPVGASTKGEKYDSIPLFLSAEYQELYKTSYERAAKRRETRSPTSPASKAKSQEEKQRAQGAAKLYKSQWVLEKLVQQQSKKRNKAKPGAARADAAEETKKKGRKGAAGGASHDALELEEVIEDLRNDLALKNEEFKEARDERDALIAENAQLKKAYEDEKIKRQTLSSNKMKNTMLGELLHNAGPIKDLAFYATKRHKSTTGGGGNFMDRIKEQKQINEPHALARKYAEKWLSKVRKTRADRENEAGFGLVGNGDVNDVK